jgi:hypothetical protein
MFIALTALPAAVVGTGIWYWAGTLPGCEVSIQNRLAAPDGRFDLVVFSRQCGGSGAPNTQAALVPAGEGLPEDAASFVSIGTKADLGARWDGPGKIELSLPPGAEIYRQDTGVAGVTVLYR